MPTQTNLTNQQLLVDLNEDVARTLIPAMIIVGILMIVGLCGNILVCIIFSTKLKSGTQNFLIVSLAVFDLLSCTIAMPTEIVDMRYYYMFTSEFACKLFRFVNVLCAMCSILTLTAIALDRFLKVCRPLGRQMSLREAKIALFMSVVVGLLLSWPAVFLYGARTAETEISGIVGTDCSTSDYIKDTSYPLIYNCVLFLGFLSLTLTFIIIYAKIYFEIKRHKKYMNKVAISTPSSPVLSTIEFNFPSVASETPDDNFRQRGNPVEESNEIPQQHEASFEISENVTGSVRIVTFEKDSSPASKFSSDSVQLSISSLMEDTNGCSKTKKVPPPLNLSTTNDRDSVLPSSGASACSTPRRQTKKRFELGRENRTTVIALCVTTIFILSYLPYLGLVFAAIFNKDFDHKLRGSDLAAFNLFLRSYFVNSAANPIIYGVLNYRFRMELKTMVKKLTKKWSILR